MVRNKKSEFFDRYRDYLNSYVQFLNQIENVDLSINQNDDITLNYIRELVVLFSDNEVV